MKLGLWTVFASFLLAGAANAECQKNLSFLESSQREIVCTLEAQAGFRVRERGIKSRHIYFINWDEQIRKNIKTRTGVAYTGQGTPFASEKAAQKEISSIAQQKRCIVNSWKFNANSGSVFEFSCKMGN